MKNYLLGLAALTLAFSSMAQTHPEHCATSRKMAEQLDADPNLRSVRQQIEEFTQHWIAENADKNMDRGGITIPVVVHVVYKTSLQNISDAQIQSQIDVLNEDYSSTNSDISGVPSVWTNLISSGLFQFDLASCDPNGFHTNGITRTETTVNSWNGSDDVKFTSLGGHDPWPASDYLNIWVCNIGSGLLGYAYQPGINPNLDGVVVGYQFFGKPSSSSTYDLGRTATHEIGHYFNLDHLWGTQVDNQNCNLDDNVNDTPLQEGPNYGCNQAYPHETCGTGSNSDMFNNYMDYGNDECLFFFTEGQKNRMLAALNGPRASLLTSTGLMACPVGVEEHILESSLNVYPNPASDVINIQSDQKDGLETDLRILDISGRTVLTRSGIRLGYSAIKIDVSELSEGAYVLELSSENEVVTRKINIVK